MTAPNKIELVERALEALAPNESACALCPRGCRVDRTRNEKGVCQTGRRASVSHALLHYGEEPVLSGPGYPGPSRKRGRAGSGTIFFTGCSLKCLFCQNYQLSWLAEGEEADDEALAGMMLKLKRQGALNINLVSPSHVLLPILRALRIALAQGLDLPIVFNSNGYDKAEVIRRLEGIVDIYLPDLKYHGADVSKRYSGRRTTSKMPVRPCRKWPANSLGSFWTIKTSPCAGSSSAISSCPAMSMIPGPSWNGSATTSPLRFISA